MTYNNQKKQNEGKNGINPVVAAVAGAVVGAGIAVAGVALADEKNREKVKEVVTKAKNQTIGYVEDMQKQAQAKKREGEEKVKIAVDSAKKSLHQASTDVNKAVQAI